MKNLLLSIILLLFTGFAFAQPLQKGNLISIHILTMELQPNVTMEQVFEFYHTKYFPAAKKHFGMIGFIGQGVRGSISTDNKLVLIWHFKTEASRDKYFKADGNFSELGEKAWAQVASINEELNKLATITSEWADWILK